MKYAELRKSTKVNLQKLAKDNFEITGWFKGCHVHHIDHDYTNNCLSNLICLTPSEHKKLHANSSITKERNSKANTGKIISEETKRKISESSKCIKHYPITEEHRRKLSESHKDNDKVKLGARIGRLKQPGVYPCEVNGIKFNCVKDAMIHFNTSRYLLKTKFDFKLLK